MARSLFAPVPSVPCSTHAVQHTLFVSSWYPLPNAMHGRGTVEQNRSLLPCTSSLTLAPITHAALRKLTRLLVPGAYVHVSVMSLLDISVTKIHMVGPSLV